MTAWDLLRAMNQMPDDWIEEALAPKRQNRRRAIAVSAAGLAACAAMALIVWRPWTIAPPAAPAVSSAGEAGDRPDEAQVGAESGAESAAQSGGNGVFVPAEPEKGVTIPKTPLPKVSESLTFDMAGFFIHDGRMYVQTGETAPAGLRGSYVFTPTGQIDEWSGAEEYVEGASSVGGDVYTVEGYDESFRLCLADGSGTFSLYDCLGGVTLKTGADLFETRLHLESRWESVSFLPDEAWQNNQTDYRPLALTDGEIEAFLSLLMAASMQDWSAGSENGDIFEQGFAQAHLRFTLTDGTSVSLRLFENGCVTYGGSAARVCAYLPGDIFDTVFAACRA